MSDPWSAQVALPVAVEQLLQNICTTQKKDPPDDDVRQKLASLGEEAALGILRYISGSVITNSLGGFILHMINKAYSPQRLGLWSAEVVALPDAVEQLLQNICTTQKKAAPGDDVRQKLASVGEEAALGILRVISGSVITNSVGGFILHMIDKASSPQAQRLSPLRTPSSPSRLMFNENALDVHKEHPPLSFPAKTIEIVNEDRPIDAGQSIKSRDADVTSKIDQEISQSVSTDLPSNGEIQLEDGDIEVEPLVIQKRQQEDKTEKKRQLEDKADGSPLKVQDQLDEVK
jgi:hypothetical protein